jgi:hypothetical protein
MSFTYNRSWEEIEAMLDRAEEWRNYHHTEGLTTKKRDDKVHHARNYKALEGVVKTLRWVLGDLDIEHPLK